MTIIKKPKQGLLLVLTAVSSLALAKDPPPDMVRAHEAINYVGELAMVCGVIASADYRRDVRGDPTFLNFDKPFPDHDFTAVIMGNDRRHFDVSPETLQGYKACVYGEVDTYKGKAQIRLKRPEQLNFKAPDS